MVFRGEYMGSAIAAKQVFADKSEKELGDFYREVSTLAVHRSLTWQLTSQ